MFACIIEYTVREGQMPLHDATLMPLMDRVASVPGFVAKDYGTNPDGRIISISYWETREALAGWVRDVEHRKAMELGKTDILGWFRIRIAEVERDYSWTLPPA